MSNTITSLRQLLKTIAREQRFYDDFELTVSPASSGGGNYTTQLYTATITSSNKAALQLFIKFAALNESFQECGMRRLFTAEFTFYTNIARTYDTIQDKYNVQGEDRLILPKFYGGNLKYLEETLVLEDLTVSGFRTCQRFKTVDWEFAAKTVEEMAKFHALSIAYGKEYPEQYQKMLEELQFILPIDKNVSSELFDKMFSTALNVTREENRDRFRKFIEEDGGFEMFYRYGTPFRCPVLAHGDLKPTNLMYRVSQDGKMDIVILDYQTMRAGSIPSDLICFIFTSTDREFRGRHMARLVEHYYASLRRALRLRGVRAHHVYPREVFDYEMKTILPYGLTVAITILPMLLVGDQDAPTVDEHLTMHDFAVKPNELYQERLNEIVDDFVEWGLL